MGVLFTIFIGFGAAAIFGLIAWAMISDYRYQPVEATGFFSRGKLQISPDVKERQKAEILYLVLSSGESPDGGMRDTHVKSA